MDLHNYFTIQYCQTNVKQEEKDHGISALGEEFRPISENIIQKHETSWLST
jgi:hypothetical protein